MPEADPVLSLVEVFRSEKSTEKEIEEAFEGLYYLFHGQVLGRLIYHLGRPEAFDAEQEVWLRVLAKRTTINPPGLFRAWLFRITFNVAMDCFRRWKKQGLVASIDSLDARSANVPDKTCRDPLEGVIANESLQALQAAWDSLSPQDQHIVLRRLEGATYDEIADELGWTLAKVRRRFLKLFKQLQGVVDGEPRGTGPVHGEGKGVGL